MLLPTAIGEQFLWRQHVTASWSDGSESFDAVLQMHGEELMLMGLGPMGRPGFIATLTTSGVTFENRSGRSLPFAPEHILADVQKVFYPWLGPVPAGFSGTRTGEHKSLMISETYAGGRLLTRVFERSDAVERGELRIRYEGWLPGLSAPQRAVLDNVWFGYELTIVTVEQHRLPDQELASGEASR
ncbi:MAG: DUF3261 domain-containing protein [Polyangiales bacterium]